MACEALKQIVMAQHQLRLSLRRRTLRIAPVLLLVLWRWWRRWRRLQPRAKRQADTAATLDG